MKHGGQPISNTIPIQSKSAVKCGCLPPWVSPSSCCNKQIFVARLINLSAAPSQDVMKHEGQPVSKAISRQGSSAVKCGCFPLRVNFVGFPSLRTNSAILGWGCRVESLFFGGMKGEVWIQPGKLPSQVSTFWRHTNCSNCCQSCLGPAVCAPCSLHEVSVCFKGTSVLVMI